MADAGDSGSREPTSKRSSRSRGSGRPRGRRQLPAFAGVHVWQIQAVRDILVVAALIAVFWAGYLLRAVTVPLLVALLLAYLFEPLVARWSSRPRMNRARVLLMLLCTVGVVAVLVVSIATTLAVGQTARLVDDIRSGGLRARLGTIDLPEFVEEDFERVLELLPLGGARPPDAAQPPVDDAAAPGAAAPEPGPLTEQRVRDLIDARLAGREPARETAPEEAQAGRWWTIARGGASAVMPVVASVVRTGFLLFLIPFYFFFFSLWYPAVIRFGRGLLPKKNSKRTLQLLGKMDAAVAGFVRGRIVISLIMGGLLAIGWWVCDVPYAIALGLITGVFCAVPYLGVVGLPVAVGLLWLESIGPGGGLQIAWWQILLWPTLVFVIVQLVEGYLLVPWIAGKATNLDPVTILVAVLAGGSVLGVYGMLLAIPAAACGKILFTDVLLPKIRAWASGQAEDPLPIERD